MYVNFVRPRGVFLDPLATIFIAIDKPFNLNMCDFLIFIPVFSQDFYLKLFVFYLHNYMYSEC